jgi:SAM-dependent methyltransferase
VAVWCVCAAGIRTTQRRRKVGERTDDLGSFWEAPERVDSFANREADQRLVELIASYDEPASIRVLDLGCAGGRNALLLAERGFDIHGLDASAAMVRRTRDRVARVLGHGEAERRVQRGSMDDLGRFQASSFDLVVAIGIYHCARSDTEWECAVAETIRVLATGGRLLVAQFAPGTEMHGSGSEALPGQPHLYDFGVAGPHYLLTADELDRAMDARGLRPEVATERIVRATEEGRRITVNGLYRKRPSRD